MDLTSTGINKLATDLPNLLDAAIVWILNNVIISVDNNNWQMKFRK